MGSGIFWFYIHAKLQRLSKKHMFLERRLRLLTRPATLSRESLEVDLGWEVALLC